MPALGGREKLEFDDFNEQSLCSYTIPTSSNKSTYAKFLTKNNDGIKLDVFRYCSIYVDFCNDSIYTVYDPGEDPNEINQNRQILKSIKASMTTYIMHTTAMFQY
jgi:hypothetical protein